MYTHKESVGARMSTNLAILGVKTMTQCCIHQHPNPDGRLWCTQCQSLLTGARIGDYTIASYLGRGSFSVVYLAHQHSLHNRKVVMKVLLPISSQETLAYFQREAQLLASMTHPYILPLYGYGVIEEQHTDSLEVAAYTPYLTLPYAEQGSVDAAFEREGRQPWSLTRVLPIIEEAAEALVYAHAHGVLHRDVKPANLLFFGSHVVLSDFGVSCLIDADCSHLQAPWAGSPAYMAPEVWQLRPGRYSDQYALAVTCFRLLTGRHPWGNADRNINWQHQHQYVAPRSLREYRPDLPAAVSVVLQRAMAKSPHDRYADIRAFAADLQLATLDSTQVSLSVPAKLIAGDNQSGKQTDYQAGNHPLVLSQRQIAPLPVAARQVLSDASAFVTAKSPVLQRANAIDVQTTNLLPATERLTDDERVTTSWHFERVGTTEILRRTARDRWTWPSLWLNALLGSIVCAIVTLHVGLGALPFVGLAVLPALIVGPVVAQFFRQFLLLTYPWGILTGLVFGVVDAFCATLACYGWAALLLTLPHWGHDWLYAGQGITIYFQQAASLLTNVLLLGLLCMWLAAFGGVCIGMVIVRKEHQRRISLDEGK